MTFAVTVERDTLSSLLAAAGSAIDPKSSVHTLHHALFRASGGYLRVAGTDLYVGAERGGAAKVHAEGEALLEYDALSKLVRQLPKADIKIEVGDARATVTHDGGSFDVGALDASDFPARPQPHEECTWHRVTAKDLALAISLVEHMAATDATRPALHGVRLELSKHGICAMGANSAGLASATVRTDITEWQGTEDPKPISKARSLTFPLPSVPALLELLGAAETADLVVTHPDYAFARTTTGDESAVMQVRLAQQNFPNLGKLIQSTDSVTIVDREDFSKSLRRVGIFSEFGIALSCDGTQLLLSGKSDRRKGGEAIATNGASKFAKVGLNRKILARCLQKMPSKRVSIGHLGSLQPLRIDAKLDAAEAERLEYMAMIMPLRSADV
ncbi:MAG: hypothetical protein AAGE52_35185 [Myxococcota bacterium]